MFIIATRLRDRQPFALTHNADEETATALVKALAAGDNVERVTLSTLADNGNVEQLAAFSRNAKGKVKREKPENGVRHNVFVAQFQSAADSSLSQMGGNIGEAIDKGLAGDAEAAVRQKAEWEAQQAEGTYRGYCMKCREHREFHGEVHVNEETGRRSAKGHCPVCDTKMNLILSNVPQEWEDEANADDSPDTGIEDEEPNTLTENPDDTPDTGIEDEEQPDAVQEVPQEPAIAPVTDEQPEVDQEPQGQVSIEFSTPQEPTTTTEFVDDGKGGEVLRDRSLSDEELEREKAIQADDPEPEEFPNSEAECDHTKVMHVSNRPSRFRCADCGRTRSKRFGEAPASEAA